MKFKKFYLNEECDDVEMFKNKLYKSLGFDENGKPIKIERKTFECKKCGNHNAYYREEHPDTDMNEIVLYCPDCKYEVSK